MMILKYAENGNLRNYLDKSYNKLTWDAKFRILFFIALGLNKIHEKELIHRDLHTGNILMINDNNRSITEMGLCKLADYIVSENTIKNIYSVLPNSA